MDAYDNFDACGALNAFVDALSNWYVRRSRDRFWSGEKAVGGQTGRLLDAVRVPADDEQADRALHAVPGRDAVAESGGRVRRPRGRERPLVRLSRRRIPSVMDETLSQQMALLREIASLGPQVRMDNG